MKTAFVPFALSLTLAGLGTASTIPTRSILPRADFCEQYGSVTTGSYIVYNDLWGLSYDTSGTQCTEVESLSGKKISWWTSYSWSGDSDQVKSYANVALDFTAKKLSAISSIDTVWKWSYSTEDIVADVSYDMFLAASASGSNEYEIMVWLAALGGAGPISSTGSAIATPEIGDVTFKLYSGTNGDTTVYSFVAESTTTSFSADLLEFFKYLEEHEGLSSSKYLTDVQAGTEPFTGTAKLTVSEYSVSVE